MKRITLFDPSLQDNHGYPSSNLGDLVIYESVKKYLDEIFNHPSLVRISTHTPPSSSVLKRGRKNEIRLFGGTNALSADLKKYHQWKVRIPPEFFWKFSFPVTDLILMGVGWWQYQGEPTEFTKKFYRKTLSAKWLHSVRDSYTKDKLEQMGITNVVNTGCPTMWELSGMDVSARKGASVNCLFTLTDYNPEADSDRVIMESLLAGYPGQLYFFPQGPKDIIHINRFPVYRKNAKRITILDRTYKAFVSCLEQQDMDYVGTRLHAGIKALQMKKNALILSVDNRATEIGKDTGLPVIKRKEAERISDWIAGATFFHKIKLPLEEIRTWKEQFAKAIS